MKKIFWVILVVLLPVAVNAQINNTREDISSELGYDYMSGITNDRSLSFICYSVPQQSNNGQYTMMMAFYFNQSNICVKYSMVWPLEEIENVVAGYDKNLTKIKYGHWVNKANGYVFKLTKSEGVFTIEVNKGKSNAKR